MQKTLISLGAWILLGWAIGEWVDPTSGWTVLTLGMVSMILVSGAQLSQIRKWVRNLHTPPPPSVGPWNEILAPIYRQ
ncbi:MAG: DUF3329 domain-containing protein, partial [Pusillimonas sp.]|nr:DUF3329 domain-containing protein [Pusillimonas sp.]